jgi:hypothetical protein
VAVGGWGWLWVGTWRGVGWDAATLGLVMVVLNRRCECAGGGGARALRLVMDGLWTGGGGCVKKGDGGSVRICSGNMRSSAGGSTGATVTGGGGGVC